MLAGRALNQTQKQPPAGQRRQLQLIRRLQLPGPLRLMSPGGWHPRRPRHRMHPNLPRPQVRAALQHRRLNRRRGVVHTPLPCLPQRPLADREEERNPPLSGPPPTPRPAVTLHGLSPYLVNAVLPPGPPWMYLHLLPASPPHNSRHRAPLPRLNLRWSLRPFLWPRMTRTAAPQGTTPTLMTTGARPGTRTHPRSRRNLPWTGILPRAPASDPFRLQLAAPPQCPAQHNSTQDRAPRQELRCRLPGLRGRLPQVSVPPIPGPAPLNRRPVFGWSEKPATWARPNLPSCRKVKRLLHPQQHATSRQPPRFRLPSLSPRRGLQWMPNGVCFRPRFRP